MLEQIMTELYVLIPMLYCIVCLVNANAPLDTLRHRREHLLKAASHDFKTAVVEIAIHNLIVLVEQTQMLLSSILQEFELVILAHLMQI